MKRLAALCVGLVSLSLLLVACGSSDGDSTSGGGGDSTSADAAPIPDGPIKIGMPIALSGPIVAFDGPMKTGAELVVNKINAEGGVDGHELELVFADTKGEVAQGATAALEVIEDGAQFVIPTPDYDLGGAAARVATNKGLITISAAGDLRFGSEFSPNLFNTYQGVPTEGAVMAEFARDKLEWDSAYTLVDTVIAHSKGACDAFESAFESRGGEIGASDTFDSTSESIAPKITQLRQSLPNVDGLLICSFPPGGASALRQIRAAGIDVPVILDQPFDSNAWEDSVPNIGEAYVVSVGIVTPGEEPDETTARVLSEAEEITGEPTAFPQGVLTAASAVEAIADAVAGTGSVEADAIRGFLEEYDKHPLAVGPTTWTPECHIRAGEPMQMARVEDGVLRFEETITPSEVPQPEC